ncbi:hypothetical protein ONZ45_g3898 [Pleurotus djamor]|nr:hypothetical protein ONZ45_g3898 [Pleurotus djamor]
MDAELIMAKTGAISNIPPETLFQAFSFLSGGIRSRDIVHLCKVCKSWTPIAQAILYQSVTLLNSRIREFARTIEENEHLAHLVQHLTLDPSSKRPDWVSVHKILRVLSPHETLLSFHLPAITRIDPESVEFTQSISLLSFLGHLDVDVGSFESLHDIKRVAASFPNLHTLDVNDAYDQDVTGDWLDESASNGLIDFPPTIRRLGYRLGTLSLLDAFLQWVPRNIATIQGFSVTISPVNDQASLASTLRSFGGTLTSLSLTYVGPSQPPSIDLRANTNLRSLMITVAPLDEDVKPLGEHLSTLLQTLSSASLMIVQFDLLLDSPFSPRYDFIDWAVLDKATVLYDAYAMFGRPTIADSALHN